VTRRFDLVVLGDVNPDLILSAPDLRVEFGQRETLATEAELLLGGSSSIVACVAASLGLRVAVAGLVGGDAYGTMCREVLRAHGVDVDATVIDPDLATGLTVILQRDGDRAIVTHPGTIAALSRRHLGAAPLAATRHVHVGSYFLLDGLRPELPAIFDAVHAAGATTSLDTNDDPAGAWQVGDLLGRCDVLLPNDREVTALAGADDVHDAAVTLAKTVDTVAVTLGDAGALAVRGEEVARASAFAVPPGDVVDAVGAGDNFDAGFLAAMLDGAGLEACLTVGIERAARSLRGRGGIGALGVTA
jgi:sugar/nucleoside kinase (ribokinase family)